MAIIKSISISPTFESLARENHCSWSEAARVGMSVLLAEKDIIPYDNNLNIYRKMLVFKAKAEEALIKLQELNKSG